MYNDHLTWQKRRITMISVLFNWLYIFIVTFLIGLVFFKLLSVFLKRQLSFSFFSLILCGVAVTTVYTQLLSLFCKIGALANLLLILLCIAAFIAYPRSFYLQYLKKLKNTFFLLERAALYRTDPFHRILYLTRNDSHRHKPLPCAGSQVV